jgi:DNA-binding MarR family transcriptional regulator
MLWHEHSLLDFIVELAPHVDRVFIAGHRLAASYARSLRDEFGLSNFGVLIDFRRQLLGAGRLPLADAAAIERYVDIVGVKRTLERHIAEGFLEARDDLYVPTPSGERLLLRLTQALEDGLRPLQWSEDRVNRLNRWCEAIIDEGARHLRTELYPAFTADRFGFVPAHPSPNFRLWTSIGTLRYLRADAHARAWHEHRLHMHEIVLLTMLCYKEQPSSVDTLEDSLGLPLTSIGKAGESLRKRGCLRIRDQEWEVTLQGRAIRRNIEDLTNALNAQPFTVLREDQRVELLHLLRDFVRVVDEAD